MWTRALVSSLLWVRHLLPIIHQNTTYLRWRRDDYHCIPDSTTPCQNNEQPLLFLLALSTQSVLEGAWISFIHVCVHSVCVRERARGWKSGICWNISSRSHKGTLSETGQQHLCGTKEVKNDIRKMILAHVCLRVYMCVGVGVGRGSGGWHQSSSLHQRFVRESTANVSMCIDSLVAVHYDATSHGTQGCYKPLYATMLQAAQCYCGSWCGLGLRSINRHQSQDYQQPVVSADIHATRNPSSLHLPPRSGFDEAPRIT